VQTESRTDGKLDMAFNLPAGYRQIHQHPVS
jgi:hypothetical protein